MDTDNQNDNKPWLWKKGQSGNPKGRPKGLSMKEYSREYLASMTDDERQDFMDGMPKEVIWKMAEGNPKESSKIEHSGEIRTTTLTPEQVAEINRIALEPVKPTDE